MYCPLGPFQPSLLLLHRRMAAFPSTSGRQASLASANPNQKRSLQVFASAREVTLLDYGAGNVRSVRNAIKKLGYTIKDVGGGHSDPPLSQTMLSSTS
jgi:glutamine amidotransferase/cyclase